MGLGALAVPSPRRSPTDSTALRPGPSESFLHLFFSLSETASIIRLPSCYRYATALKSSQSIDFFFSFLFFSETVPTIRLPSFYRDPTGQVPALSRERTEWVLSPGCVVGRCPRPEVQ